MHTPGPWHRNIKPAKKYNTIFAGRNTHVAHLNVSGLSDEEVEANCNLVAAAPELLAALEMLYDRWENGDPVDEGGHAVELSGSEEQQILAAFAKCGIDVFIAKAEGRQ